MGAADILERLDRVIRQRKSERPDGSYVAELLAGGVERAAAKVTEEAAELVEAAREGGADAVTHEAADLLFHTWVLLAAAGVPPGRVLDELDGRFGTGGLEEKARRGAGGSRAE